MDHNAIPDSGFRLGINQFADLTDEEFLKSHTGLKVPAHKTEAMKGLSVPYSPPPSDEEMEQEDRGRGLRSATTYKNWFTEGAVTVPYDQGMCGGCWSFSSVSAVESMAYIEGVNKELQEYSVQQLLDCDTDNYECTGGWMYQGFAYISNNGVLKKDDYRAFGQRVGPCEATEEVLKEKGHMKNIGFVEHDRRSNEQLKKLIDVRPVSMSMYTTGMMGAYESGVMSDEFLHCSYSDLEVNHGVVMVGYGRATHKDYLRGRCKEYWIIRNSWGPNWGEHGFFRLCMDHAGSTKLPFGSCLVNKYTTWPTMDPSDIDLSQAP